MLWPSAWTSLAALAGAGPPLLFIPFGGQPLRAPQKIFLTNITGYYHPVISSWHAQVRGTETLLLRSLKNENSGACVGLLRAFDFP